MDYTSAFTKKNQGIIALITENYAMKIRPWYSEYLHIQSPNRPPIIGPMAPEEEARIMAFADCSELSPLDWRYMGRKA